jgi:hypothetical protein
VYTGDGCFLFLGARVAALGKILLVPNTILLQWYTAGEVGGLLFAVLWFNVSMIQDWKK